MCAEYAHALQFETCAQATLPDAQVVQDASGAQTTLTEKEKVSLDRMQDDNYGKPWCLSARSTCDDHKVKDPVQVFSWTLPEDNVHLPRTCLCGVDLMFGDEREEGILDTGTQRSLLSASSYERIRTKLPPLQKLSNQ